MRCAGFGAGIVLGVFEICVEDVTARARGFGVRGRGCGPGGR